MGRPTITLKSRLNEYKNQGFVASKNGKLFCNFCSEEVCFEKKSTIDNHLKSSSHIRRAGSASQCPPIDKALANQDANKIKWKSLGFSFAASGIPLHVFRNTELRNWMTEHVKGGEQLPSETTMRKYLTESGKDDIKLTKKLCKDKDLIVMVDETQDFRNRKIINVLFRPAEPNMDFRLVYTEILDTCDGQTVVQKILKAVQILKTTVDRIVALVTDNAANMMLAGKLMKNLNSRFMHSSCWAYIVHIISDEIRLSMKEADRFIALVKACLVKAPSRRQELCQVLVAKKRPRKLPPSPVLTRWTTWLSAGSYDFENFEAVKEWVQRSKPDSAAMRELKELVCCPELIGSLQEIHSVCNGICSTIKKLEAMTNPASDVYLLISTLRQLVEEKLGRASVKLEKYWTGKGSHPAIQFWRDVQFCDPKKFKLNPVSEIPASLTIFSQVTIPPEEVLKYRTLCDLMEESDITPFSFWNLHKREMPNLCKLAAAALSIPPSSAEVERSFSSLKMLIQPERNRLTEENLGVHLRIRFNNRNHGALDPSLNESVIDSSDDDDDDDH